MATRKLGTSALQQAYYDRLTTHANTSGYRIFNYVPAEDKTIDTSFPFIQFGTPIGVRSSSFGAADTEAEENTMIINVWSDYMGDSECAEIMDNVVQAIHSSRLTIVGYVDVLALMEYSEILEDSTEPGRILRHGVIRFSHVME